MSASMERSSNGSPGEREIEARFREEDLSPHTWGNGPGYEYGWHSHGYHKVLYCVSGSIVFHTERLTEGRILELLEPLGRRAHRHLAPHVAAVKQVPIFIREDEPLAEGPTLIIDMPSFLIRLFDPTHRATVQTWPVVTYSCSIEQDRSARDLG